MKRIFLVLLLIITPIVAFASPYLVGDPQQNVTLYKITGPEWTIPFQALPAQADGSIKLNLAEASVGVNDLSISACTRDDVWGEVCADPVPFVFTRPSLTMPNGVLNLRLQR